jgi:ketosteroid isomerase-like protein
VAQPLLREPVNFPAKTRKHRNLDEWVWARIPALIPLSTATILRLPARSRIRRTMILYWVRRSYEIVNRRDFELALAAQAHDLTIKFTAPPDSSIPLDLVNTEFRGRDGFYRAWNTWLESFDDLRVEPEEVSDAGGSQLLIAYRSIGRGTLSGALVDQRAFTLYTFRGGKVASQEFFVDREKAERAAGIQPA